MSPRPSQPVNRPVTIALCLFAVLFATAIFAAATAHAAYYKTLYCGAADGSGNPVLGARPGFFDFTDDCGTAYGDPAGTGGFLRLEENTTGTAGNTDEASYSWWPPAGTSIAAVSTYTRVPGYFNSGWRSRFWGEGYDGGEYNILMQGSGVPYEGINAPATSNFNYHAWPFGSYGDYKRLVFAMTCYRPAGCSRTGWNAADANSIAITLNDKEAPTSTGKGNRTSSPATGSKATTRSPGANPTRDRDCASRASSSTARPSPTARSTTRQTAAAGRALGRQWRVRP